MPPFRARRRYGQYAVATAMAGVFQLLAAFPVESGLPKFLAEARVSHPSEMRSYYAAGLTLRLAVSGLAVVLAWRCGPLVASLFGRPRWRRWP